MASPSSGLRHRRPPRRAVRSGPAGGALRRKGAKMAALCAAAGRSGPRSAGERRGRAGRGRCGGAGGPRVTGGGGREPAAVPGGGDRPLCLLSPAASAGPRCEGGRDRRRLVNESSRVRRQNCLPEGSRSVTVSFPGLGYTNWKKIGALRKILFRLGLCGFKSQRSVELVDG